jgi:hypothetical protein
VKYPNNRIELNEMVTEWKLRKDFMTPVVVGFATKFLSTDNVLLKGGKEIEIMGAAKDSLIGAIVRFCVRDPKSFVTMPRLGQLEMIVKFTEADYTLGKSALAHAIRSQRDLLKHGSNVVRDERKIPWIILLNKETDLASNPFVMEMWNFINTKE